MLLVFIYLLTPWCRVLVEKLIGLQRVKKFPSFQETQMFITAPTILRHLYLSWAIPIQSMYSHPTCWRSILIFHPSMPSSPQYSLSLQFPTKTLYTPSYPIHATCPANLFLLDFITHTIFDSSQDHLAPQYADVPTKRS